MIAQVHENFHGPKDDVKHIGGTVVSLLSSKMLNHFHWTAEGLSRFVTSRFIFAFSNPYHRLLLTHQYVTSHKSALRDVKVLIPSKVLAAHVVIPMMSMLAKAKIPHIWATIEMLGLDFGGAFIEHQPELHSTCVASSFSCISITEHSFRYHFDKLLSIQWEQPNTDDADQNDLWSGYLPPKV